MNFFCVELNVVIKERLQVLNANSLKKERCIQSLFLGKEIFLRALFPAVLLLCALSVYINKVDVH